MTTIVDPEDSPRPDDAVMDFGLDDLEARMIAIAQDGELSDEARRAQLLDALTTTRGAGRDRIRRAFEAGASGASVLAWQSELMDGLLRVLLTFFSFIWVKRGVQKRVSSFFGSALFFIKGLYISNTKLCQKAVAPLHFVN